VADSTKFKGPVDARREREDEDAPATPALDRKPRGLWQQLDGRTPEPNDPHKPHGMWEWVNARAQAGAERDDSSTQANGPGGSAEDAVLKRPAGPAAGGNLAIARSGGHGTPGAVPAAVKHALASETGSPLPDPEQWSARVGADVRHAKVVTSAAAASAAASINARAFTVGDRVFMGGGADATTDGGALLAHELTHVAQQRGAQNPSSWDQVPFVHDDDPREHAAREQDAGADHTDVSGIGIARWGDGSSVPARQFLRDVGWLDTTLDGMFVKMKVVERGPFGHLLAEGSFYSRFKDDVLNETLKTRLDDLIAPEPVVALIDRARALDWEQPDKTKPAVPTNVGSNRADDQPVLIEIGNAVIRHYNESMARMFPRAAASAMQKNQGYAATKDKFVPWVDVTPAELPVSHPMDTVIRKIFLEGRWLYDTAFRTAVTSGQVKANATDAPTSTVPAKISFVPNGKLWHWVKAVPEESTAEQVATALFGRPEDAHRLTSMAPLWGFHARDVLAFSDQADALFERVKAEWKNPDPSMRPPEDIAVAVGYYPPPTKEEGSIDVDPAAELIKANDPTFAVQRNKQNAAATADRSKPPGAAPEVHDEANIIDAQKALLKTLGDLDKLVPLFRRPLTTVTAARARFQTRLDEASSRCLPDCEAVYALADAQRGVLTKVSIGIADMASKLVQGGESGAPDSVRQPLEEVVDAYLDTLSAIELPELAKPRCAKAEALGRNVDITLQEAALHERLGELEGEIHENQVKPDAKLDPWKHRDSLDSIAMQLAEARVTNNTTPVQTKQTVDALKPKTDSLGFEIGLAEKLARLNMLWELMDSQEDIWEGMGDNLQGKVLKKQNRALYVRFRDEVFVPFKKADEANDDHGRTAAQKAYRDILTGPEMKAHGETVREFMLDVAKHKKWSKFIVSLAIAFVAFGLGQWEFGAVLAAEGSLFSAAVAGGLVATTTSVVLNKVIFDQNPTLAGVLTSFLFNAGTFFVVGKMALAARAAGAEAALAEGTVEAKALAEAGSVEAGSAGAATATTGSKVAAAGKYALALGKEAIVAEVMGFAQAEIESLAAHHRTLNSDEATDLFYQSLAAVVGMRVFHAVTPSDLFQYKTPEQKLTAEIKWLEAEQKALSARAQDVGSAARENPLAKPDKASVAEVLDRWKVYLEREQAARKQMIEYAERHPQKFKAGDVEKLKASGTDPTLLRQMRETQALLAVEPDGVNRFTCAAGKLDVVMEQHRAVGNEITKISTDEQTGQRTITIKPKDGVTPPFEITEKVPPKGQRTAAKVAVGSARQFEQWLDSQAMFKLSPAEQHALRDLYARDPEAAINLASEKHGYQAQSVAEPKLMVQADAPGSKPPVEPVVTQTDHEMSVTLGHGVTALGNSRFLAAPTELAGMHESWSGEKGTKPSKIVYDPETNVSHFEMTVDGKLVRVEAQLAPRIESFGDINSAQNRVLGGRISQPMAETVMRGVANGEHELLKATGIGGEPTRPNQMVEFGLGKLSDGTGYVIVLGEPNAVDWAALPGIEPGGHSHPLHPGNNLRPDVHGRQAAPMAELLDPGNGASINRQLIFPSVEDFVMMASRHVVGHKVFTGFINDAGVVRKPVSGETAPGLEFTIGKTTEIGTIGTQRVFESTIEGKAGAETPISERKIWIVEETPGGSGYLYMSEPPGLTRALPKAGAKAGAAKTKGTLTPEMEHLAKQHGEKQVHWALESLPDGDVERVVSLPEPLLKQLMDVTGVQARDLIAAVGQKRVETALHAGSPLSAKQLVKLHEQLGNAEAVKDMLDSAGTKAKDLARVARVADGLEPAVTRLPPAKLETSSISLDSNARSAIEDLVRGTNKQGTAISKFSELDANYQQAVNAIRNERRLPVFTGNEPAPMSVEAIVGKDADLRGAQVVGAEGIAGETMAGAASKVLPVMKGVATDRTNPDYGKAIAELATADVGGPTGAMDRTIVADLLFAEGTPATFVSVDSNVVARLASNFGDPVKLVVPRGEKTTEVLARTFPDGTFTIKVQSRTLTVRFK